MPKNIAGNLWGAGGETGAERHLCAYVKDRNCFSLKKS